MRNRVRIVYIISLILMFFMLTIFAFGERVDEKIMRGEADYTILTDYELTAYENEEAPIGITQEYRWTLENVPTHDACVTFYIIHQEVEVYVDDELIYSLTKAEGDYISKTVGCDWAQAFLLPEDEGKELRILVHPIYESSIGNELTIYYGDHGNIRDAVLQNNIGILGIGIAAILIGLVFVGFVAINIKNLEVDRSVYMLGIFSIFSGLWKISDMAAAPLLFKDSQTLSAIAIISIFMMVAPYLYFIRNQLSSKYHLRLDIACIIASVIPMCFMVLQVLGLYDLREILTTGHCFIVAIILVLLVTIIQESRIHKFSRKLAISIICCVLCLVGTVIDMIAYYKTGNSGDMIYGLLAFLIYVVSMGYVTLKETKLLMQRGEEAAHYQSLAMHDELTGLYNRAHYADFIEKNNVLGGDCYLIMMDVNDLKLCNDTRGHNWGDQLLIDSANLIQKAFPRGVCHRVGGDEFCVLLCNSNVRECHDCLNTFDQLVEEFNQEHPDSFPVDIAYGYANYISKIDFDFNDTLRRADRMMYQMKLNMKTNVR